MKANKSSRSSKSDAERRHAAGNSSRRIIELAQALKAGDRSSARALSRLTQGEPFAVMLGDELSIEVKHEQNQG